MNKIKQLFVPLASFQITLGCLVMTMMLVFFGTLAQVHIGTFAAQKEYFHQFFVMGEPFGFKMPILPGGLLVGVVWIVNLTAAFVVRFRLNQRKFGLFISHGGIILLLVGQFFTQMMSQESHMAVQIGQTSNYSEVAREAELVFINDSDSKYDEVTSISQHRLSQGGWVEASSLPFKVRIKEFMANAELKNNSGMVKPMATKGIGVMVSAQSVPAVSSDDEMNAVSAYIELFEGEKSLGVWLASMGLGAPQSVQVNGKNYAMAMRPRRAYVPFSVTLKEFKHDIYPGTDIPKNFSSLIHLKDDQTGEDRDTLIYMNHPLRYRGHTFFQASFGNNDTLSIFQVVKNPAWISPYISCFLVVLGLAIQFLTYLTAFIRNKK